MACRAGGAVVSCGGGEAPSAATPQFAPSPAASVTLRCAFEAVPMKHCFLDESLLDCRSDHAELFESGLAQLKPIDSDVAWSFHAEGLVHAGPL